MPSAPQGRQASSHARRTTHLRLRREVCVLADGLVHAALGGGHGAGRSCVQAATCGGVREGMRIKSQAQSDECRAQR